MMIYLHIKMSVLDYSLTTTFVFVAATTRYIIGTEIAMTNGDNSPVGRLRKISIFIPQSTFSA